MSSVRVLESSKFVDVWAFAPAKPIAWVLHAGAAPGQLLKLLLERSRQRYELSELDPRMLRDIGVTEEQAGHEIRKPIWQD